MWLNFPFKNICMFRRVSFIVSERKTDRLILKVIIANITSILYILKHILRAIIENIRVEILFAGHSVSVISYYWQIHFSAHHRGVNDIFGLRSITVSLFFDCQKHENTTVKSLQWDEEMKTLQCLHFLCCTLRNYIYLYNRVILAIIIMFIHSGIAVT